MFNELKNLVDNLASQSWNFSERAQAVEARKVLQAVKKEVQNCRVKVLQARKVGVAE